LLGKMPPAPAVTEAGASSRRRASQGSLYDWMARAPPTRAPLPAPTAEDAVPRTAMNSGSPEIYALTDYIDSLQKKTAQELGTRKHQ
jgi:hypothetical protein